LTGSKLEGSIDGQGGVQSGFHSAALVGDFGDVSAFHQDSYPQILRLDPVRAPVPIGGFWHI